jgi:spermidine synthase
MLVGTFGATVYAMGAVVTSFMAGLALGSYLFGRYADRGRVPPLALYGILQLGIAVFAVVFPFILRGITAVHVAAFRQYSTSFQALTLLRFGLCFIALVIPTTLMGATLPVVVRFATRRLPRLGSTVASLYSVNTFGAMVGTFAAGFLLIELVGIRATSLIAASVNAAVGVTAIVVGSRLSAGQAGAESEATHAPRTRVEREPAVPDPAPGARLETRLVLLGAGIAGLAALSHEVLWTRIMVYVLGNFVHSFSLVLMSFLFGIAVGSAVVSRFIDRREVGLRLFGGLQFAIGLFAILLIPLFAPLIGLRDSFLEILTGEGVGIDTPDPWWQFTLWKMGVAFLLLLVPTFMMGASFPIAAKIYTRSRAAVGRSIGNVSAVNTLGAIVGAFLASFVLVGALGVRTSAIATASISIALGATILWLAPTRGPSPNAGVRRRGRKRPSREPARALRPSGPAAVVVGIVVVVLAVATIGDDVFVRMYETAERNMRLVYVDESTSGTVTVHRAPSGNMVLDINGLNVAGTKFGFLATQKLQAHLPLLTHPDPKSVMQIGFGSGGTCSSIATHPGIERIDCVEISPAVIEASTMHFASMGRGVLDDPRVSLTIEDARNYVLATDHKYDVILSDSIHPRYVGNGNLYTREYFELCKDRLADDGILSFWLPTYLLSPAEYKMIVRTLRAVFPHVIIWYMNNTVEAYSVAMGSANPLFLDLERVRRSLEVEAVRADLAVVRMDRPLEIVDCLAVHGRAVGPYVGEGLLNTEDRPLIEFRAPRNMIRERGEWMNLREIVEARSFPDDVVVNWGATPEEAEAAVAEMRTYYAATTYVLAGHLHHIARNLRAEVEAYERALAINPEDRDAPYLGNRAVRISRRERVD